MRKEPSLPLSTVRFLHSVGQSTLRRGITVPLSAQVSWLANIEKGESGAGARPIKKEWVLSIRDQCLKVGVPFFFKQWGGVRKKQAGRKLDGKTYNEFPNRTELPVMEKRKRLVAIAEIASLYPSPSAESEPDLFSAQQ